MSRTCEQFNPATRFPKRRDGWKLAGEIYDHIAGLVAMGIIFISAVLIIPNLSYVNVLYVDQQQLRNTALETLKAMLLEPGYPANWGSRDPFDQDNVTRFGLAHSDSSSFYVLDSDKVQRLVEGNPIGYVDYDAMRHLLGLEGYGFNIRIIPPFKATIEEKNITLPNINFKVKVSHNNGRPIANAAIDATAIYATQDAPYVNTTSKGVLTDPLGTCGLTLNVPQEIDDVAVIFKVTVADVASVFATYQSTPPDDIADISMVGDTIILTQPANATSPHPETRINYIFTYSPGVVAPVYEGAKKDKLTYWKGEGEPPPGYKIWFKTFNGLSYGNPLLLICNFKTTVPDLPPPARRHVLVLGPYPNLLGSRVLQYGDASGAKSATSIVKLQRAVIISRMTYIAEITLWKEFQ